jgi:hypothetical protein
MVKVSGSRFFCLRIPHFSFVRLHSTFPLPATVIVGNKLQIPPNKPEPGYRSRYSDWLRAG